MTVTIIDCYGIEEVNGSIYEIVRYMYDNGIEEATTEDDKTLIVDHTGAYEIV